MDLALLKTVVNLVFLYWILVAYWDPWELIIMPSFRHLVEKGGRECVCGGESLAVLGALGGGFLECAGGGGGGRYPLTQHMKRDS